MNLPLYYVIHVLGIVLLTAFTFHAFANPDPKHKRGIMMVTGILSIVVLVAGFGLKAKLGLEGWPGWLIAKIGIWFAVSSMAAMAYRGPRLAGVFRLVTIVLVAAALYLVYAKPF